MRQFLFLSTAVALSLISASAASAASFVNDSGSVSLDALNPFSWVVGVTATTGADYAGATGSITLNFLGTNAARTQYNFSYSLANTSVSPSLSSRLGVFGFDTSAALASVTTGATNRFSAALNSGNFSGLGNRDVCFYSGPNCNGSGNNGVGITEAPATGTFNLIFNAAQDNVVLGQFAARWQATGLNASGSTSGIGQISAVPEPQTWAMMLLGFGLAGYGIRRRNARLNLSAA